MKYHIENVVTLGPIAQATLICFKVLIWVTNSNLHM
jgi:hypothetical protein